MCDGCECDNCAKAKSICTWCMSCGHKHPHDTTCMWKEREVATVDKRGADTAGISGSACVADKETR